MSGLVLSGILSFCFLSQQVTVKDLEFRLKKSFRLILLVLGKASVFKTKKPLFMATVK